MPEQLPDQDQMSESEKVTLIVTPWKRLQATLVTNSAGNAIGRVAGSEPRFEGATASDSGERGGVDG